MSFNKTIRMAYFAAIAIAPATYATVPDVPLWGKFEIEITNTSYDNIPNINKFSDVDLDVQFVSPSSETIDFWGFFDGHGNGGGEDYDRCTTPGDFAGEISGSQWKIRFMPTEVGTWNYTYRFDDDPSTEVSGQFNCVATGARPGPLRVLETNTHWFQTSQGDALFPKVFYPVQADQMAYTADFYGPQVYQEALNRGYNMIQLDAMSLVERDQIHPDNGNSELGFEEPDEAILIWYRPTTTDCPPLNQMSQGHFDLDRFNLFALHRLEDHIEWLAERDTYIIPFQGFASKSRSAPIPYHMQPNRFPAERAQRYLKYLMARLAPYYNMTWNYTWEVDPTDTNDQQPQNFGTWIDDFDPWDHLYTTEACNRGDFSDDVYDIATAEYNNGCDENDDPLPPDAFDDPANAYFGFDKPIYLAEDHGPLWRYLWTQTDDAPYDITNTDACGDKETFGDNLSALEAAWSYTLQGVYVCWTEWYNDPDVDDGTCPGHCQGDLCAITWDKYWTADLSTYMTIMNQFISGETNFAKLRRHRDWVNNDAYCLASDDKYEYVIYVKDQTTIDVDLTTKRYEVTWINPEDDARVEAAEVIGTTGVSAFDPPSSMLPHAVLHLRQASNNGGDCPSVGVFTGTNYEFENNVLSGFGAGQSGQDQCHLRVEPVETNGRYKFDMIELADDVASFDDVSLRLIDHSPSFSVAVSSQGEVFRYNNVFTGPAVDDQGNDVTTALSAEDGDVVAGSDGDYVEVTLGLAPADGGIMFIDHYKDTYAGLEIQTFATGQWEKVRTIHPRVSMSADVVPVAAFGYSIGEPLKVRVLWHGDHELDQVAYLPNVPGYYIEHNLDPLVAAHSRLGNVFTTVNEVVEMISGDDIALEFDAPQVFMNFEREFVFVTEGDYSVTNPPTREAADTTPIALQTGFTSIRPNPFNPTTEISFTLASSGESTLRIFDISGRQVRELWGSGVREAGEYSVTWHGRDDNGSEVSTGVYFVTLERDGAPVATEKLHLLK